MPSRDPPVPVSGAYSPLFNVGDIVFDRDLELGVLDHTNWSVREGNRRRTIISAIVIPGSQTQVRIVGGAFVPEMGPKVVDYSPPPFDVVSDTFKPTPADAFADFPIA